MIFLFKQPGARSCFNPAESKIHCGSQHPFVAAKENGPPAAAVAAEIFRVRFYFSLRQRRMVPPATVVTAAIFRVRFYFS